MKNLLFSIRGGPDLSKWRRAPGGCVTPLCIRYTNRLLQQSNSPNFVGLYRPQPSRRTSWKL